MRDKRFFQFFVLGLTFVVGNLANYVFQILSARNLGPESYGLMAGIFFMFTVLTVGGQSVQATVARSMIIKDNKDHRTSFPDSFTITFTKRICFLSLAIICLSPLFSAFLKIGVLPILSISVFVFPAFWDSIAMGRLQGTEKFGLIGIFSMVQALSRVAVTLLVFRLGGDVTSLLFAVSAVCLLVSVLEFGPTVSDGLISKSKSDHLVLGNFVGIVSFWLILSMDSPIARALLPPHQAGVYAAQAIQGKIALWGPLVLVQVLYPSLVKGSLNNESLTRLIMIGGSTSISIFLLFFGDNLSAIIYGSEFVSESNWSWLVALAMIPFVLANYELSKRMAKADYTFIPFTIAALVGSFLSVTLIPGVEKAIIAWLFISGLLLLVTFQVKLDRRNLIK